MSWSDLADWGTNQYTGTSNGNTGGNSNFDWGSLWGDIAGSGGDSGDSGSGSSLGTYTSILSSFFGGGSGGSGGTNWGGILASGAAGAAQSLIDEKTMKEKGKQDRMTTAFEAELGDYYKQKGKARKRVALDTYGQFDLTKRWAPNMQAAPAVEVPTKPTP